jgi:hypothetical protein
MVNERAESEKNPIKFRLEYLCDEAPTEMFL